MRTSVKNQSGAGMRVAPLCISGLVSGSFGCLFFAPVIVGTTVGWVGCGPLVAVGLGVMAALAATEDKLTWTKQEGGQRGAMAAALTISVAWALSLSFMLIAEFSFETHGLRPMTMPAAFATTELSENAHMWILYLSNYSRLFFQLALQVAVAGLTGAITGAISTSTKRRRMRGPPMERLWALGWVRELSASAAGSRKMAEPAWRQGVTFGVVASGLLTLLVSTPVLAFGGEALSRSWWLRASGITFLASAALLAVAGIGLLLIWQLMRPPWWRR
jgi:hypothetical protein